LTNWSRSAGNRAVLAAPQTADGGSPKGASSLRCFGTTLNRCFRAKFAPRSPTQFRWDWGGATHACGVQPATSPSTYTRPNRNLGCQAERSLKLLEPATLLPLRGAVRRELLHDPNHALRRPEPLPKAHTCQLRQPGQPLRQPVYLGTLSRPC
jgi:hypothetical protein